MLMNVKEAIRQRRTIRLFADRPIDKKVLTELMELGRFYPSGGNRQPLAYAFVTKEDTRAEVFSCLRWAGYLPDFVIAPERRPQAYIVILADCAGADQDVGAAAMSFLLAAKSEGIDGCWLGAIDRPKLGEILGIDPSWRIAAVLALGYPAQESVAEDMVQDHKYYLDEENVLHVPKRTQKQIIVYSDL